MYNKSLTALLSLSSSKISDFINSFDTVLTDCDGVLWMENQAIDKAPEVINKFRELGKNIFFVTNNSTKFLDDFVRKARDLGFKCNENEMISTSYLAANYLKERNIKKAYVLGSKGITQELDRVGIRSDGVGPDVMNKSIGDYVKTFKLDPEIGAVVVGFDEHVSYIKLLKAASYLGNPKCIFLATNTDENFPVSSNLVIPGTGTIVAAVATCSGRQPTVLGKPNPYIVEALMNEYKIDPKRTLMIGDRCNTDILLGHNCGFQTMLVLSGVTKLQDAIGFKNSKHEKDRGLVPDVYLEKLGDLYPHLATM